MQSHGSLFLHCASTDRYGQPSSQKQEVIHIVELDKIVEAVVKAKAESKERKFTQSIDLALSLRDMDLKDPNKRFRAEVLLPHPTRVVTRLCIIGDESIISLAKDAGVPITLNAGQVDELARNPKEAKALLKKVDFFLAIPQMMAVVGKSLGRYLGPAGKMPSVLPPNADISSFVTRYSRTCKIRLRQNPVLHVKVATEAMENHEIAENINVIINDIQNRLEQGANNIRSIFVKTTMGPAIEIGA